MPKVLIVGSNPQQLDSAHLTQVLEVKGLHVVSTEVVEAAQDSLGIRLSLFDSYDK